ncbi:MAG TPA: DUF6427 family protein [Bacteroidales bacterium]|nr:DUF6427 family protein [Bacteroidales bacterium]HPM86381.1 DUF6427 family protein [Bacteroidales bacterium]HQM68544.1 DUF6427 family protein [Bacteroidales bacterium]
MLILLWLSAFINPRIQPSSVYEIRSMPLYNIAGLITGSSPRAGVIFSFIILAVLLFLLVNFNTSVFFIGERTFLPAVFFTLFSAVMPSLQVMNPVLPSAVFLTLALKRIMEAYRKPGTAFNFFDAALLISTGSLFYANMIWFGLLVFIGIALLRTGNIIEIFTSVIGLLTPYIFLYGIYYVLGMNIVELSDDIRENLFTGSPGTILSRLEIVALVISGLMILSGIVYLAQHINSMKIKSRKTFYLLLWGLFISVVLYIALPSASAELLWVIAIPACYILANHYINIRKRIIPEIFFAGFMLMVIIIQVFSLF